VLLRFFDLFNSATVNSICRAVHSATLFQFISLDLWFLVYC